MESDSRSGSPRLLVLGAGPAQLGLLEAARARGLWVAVVDRDPAAPGFRFADRRCILSTEDEPAIERLVGALGDRRHDRAGHRLAGRRRRARSPSAPGCRIRSRPPTARARDEQAAPARAARRGGRPAAALVGRRRRGRALPRDRGPVRRQGARPAGPEGARRSSRIAGRARPRRSRRRARSRATGSCWSRSSSPGPR